MNTGCGKWAVMYTRTGHEADPIVMSAVFLPYPSLVACVGGQKPAMC